MYHLQFCFTQISLSFVPLTDIVLSSGCLVSFGHFHLKQRDVQFLGGLTGSSTFFSIFSLFLSLQELRAQGVTAKQVFKKAE